jgi:pyrroline-5-carboxylate reductase
MDNKKPFRVGIIGVGNMGSSLVAAVLKTGISGKFVAISDNSPKKIDELVSKFECNEMETLELSQSTSNVFIVVKPQDLHELLDKVGKSIGVDQRVVSFVAGKKTSRIESFLNAGVPVLRVMPNIPMSVGVGATAISKGKFATDDDVKAVQELLKGSGKTIVVDESLQDAVTATSGSGPAYFFKFVEAMIEGAIELGLSEADAKVLVIQTIVGAAEMLKVEGSSPKKLRENVTSPNGTTFAALKTFDEGGITDLVKKAMRAARDRSQELS